MSDNMHDDVETRSMCGSMNELQHVEQYDGTLGVTTDFVNAHQAAVGQIQWNDDLDAKYTNPGNVSGERWCSGTMISDDLFLTAGHCLDSNPPGFTLPLQNGASDVIQPAEIATNMHVNFNYQEDVNGNLQTEESFPVIQLVEHLYDRSSSLDYAIVRLGGKPGRRFGRAKISKTDAAVDDMVCIIGHPNAQPKQIEAGPVTVLQQNIIGYNDIDTFGGTSGSGILRAADGQLVGVHTQGGCDKPDGFNYGVRITSLIDQSPTLQALTIGPERFNMIWNEGSNPRRAAWGLTRDQLHDENDKQKADGYRLQRVNAYVLPEGVYYNAIFQKIDQLVMHYSTQRTRDQFETRHDELKEQGFQLAEVNTFILNGEERWNAIWISHPTNIWESVLARTNNELNQDIDQYKAKNFRPETVNAYVLPNGKVRWNAIFVPESQFGGDRLWRLRRNKTREEFDQLAVENREEGYKLVDLNTYILPNGEGERWNGYWEKPGASTRGSWAWPRRDAERRVAEQEEDGYQPWVLNAYVIPPALTGSELISFQPPPQTNLRPVILGIAVDENRVYATRYFETVQPPHEAAGNGKLLVLDRATMQTIGEVELGRQPRELAVNSRTNKIYAINRLDGNISVIDGTSLTVTKTIDAMQGATGIAVNSVLNRIYVSNWLKRQIQVIDGATDEQLEPIPIGPGPWGLTVDETTNRLYVALSNRAFEPHVTALGVVMDHGNQRQIETIVPLGSVLNQPHDVAVDPVSDRIYVANLGGGDDSGNDVQPNVMVFQRGTLNLIGTIPVSGPARTIAFNSDARQVFVGTDRGLHVINANLLEVERIIPAGKAPWTIAVAGDTARQVFVGDAQTGEIARFA